MININLFDGAKSSLDYKIIKYINDNLEIMIEVYLGYLDANDGFDLGEKLIEVLPRDYVIRKPEECRRLVDELYEIITSSTIRDYIKPKYEYLLYQIMYRWMDICDDDNEYIPIKLTTDLRDDISKCDHYVSEESGNNFVLNNLEDFDNFVDICFCDMDFLPNQLEKLVILYLRYPEIIEVMFPDVDLDEYVDLMPVDLRELYFDEKRPNISHNEEPFKILLNAVIFACLQLQGNRKFKDAIENERNSFVSSILEAQGYYVKDQSLWGKSNEGKSPGEIDIFVRQSNGEPFSIIEALNLDSLNKSYIDLHLKKIFGYDPNGLKHNFILVYSTAKKFSELWNKYIKYMPIVEYPYTFVEFREKESNYSELKIGTSLHLRSSQRVYLHHVFINLAS